MHIYTYTCTYVYTTGTAYFCIGENLVFVCVCIYIYIYIWSMYVCVYIQLCIHMYTTTFYISVYMHSHVRTCKKSRKYAFVCVCIWIRMLACVLRVGSLVDQYECIHVYVYTCMHTRTIIDQCEHQIWLHYPVLKGWTALLSKILHCSKCPTCVPSVTRQTRH